MSSTRSGTDEKLGANSTFDFAFNKLITVQNDYPESSISVIEPVAAEKVYGARFTANGQQIVLLSGANDKAVVSSSTNNIGTTPLPHVLNKIRSLQIENPQDTYLIPLAECQTIYLQPRQHWTVLMIQNNDCYFFDPCSASLWPSAMTASCFYSLEPLIGFLKTAGFNLSSQNITYLGWQQDTVNCGRYCAAIIAKIADMLFTNEELTLINTNLPKTSTKPNVEVLIQESANCIADKLVAGNKLICDVRSQEFISPKLTRKDLIRFASQNHPLNVARKNNFFEEGEGGLAQFISDAPRRKIIFKKTQKATELLDEETTIASLAIKLGWDELLVNNMLAAHSQGPFGFLPFVLWGGVKEHDPLLVAVGQPPMDDLQIRIFRAVKTNKKTGISQKILKLVCEYQGLPIISPSGTSDKPVGYLDGPIKVNFELKQIADKWGWQLQTVETTNSDILRILTGMQLPAQYFTTHLCRAPSIKIAAPGSIDFKPSHYTESKEIPDETIPLAKPEEEQKQNDQISALDQSQETIIKLTNELDYVKKQNNQSTLKIQHLLQLLEQEKAKNAELITALDVTNRAFHSAQQELRSLPASDSSLSLVDINLSNDSEHEEQKAIDEQQLIRFTAPNPHLVMPMQRKVLVNPYIAGALVTTGLTVTGGLIIMGIISLSILAAIPIIGWGIATGFCAALAVMLTVKSIMNTLANRQLTVAADQQPREAAAPLSLAPATDPATQRKPSNEVHYSPTRSSREVHGFLSPLLSLEPQLENNDVTNNSGPRPGFDNSSSQ